VRVSRVSLVLAVLLPAFPQTHTTDEEKNKTLVAAAAKEGVELPAKANVHDSVGVTAVLLTQPTVRRLFGREISDTYAVVQLTISNTSGDAAFVIHSAYIDTSQWALGGGTRGFSFDNTTSNYPGEQARAGSWPNQIASVESRIARGQLLDAQQWSARNWTIRLLTVAGSLASGYSFAFKEAGIAKGIAAFSGDFVPGVALAWPDGAVAQQNRISDVGYQTNKIIGKQSSDIIVCFFPIDMFLSAPIRQIFLKSPGLFQSPYQILFTDANEKIRKELGVRDELLPALRKLHPCYSKMFEPSASASKTESGLLDSAQTVIQSGCKAMLADSANAEALVGLDYIGRFGIQNIRVYVDGIMTVDIDTVPASIDQVVFDDATKPEFWAVPGDKKGTLQCRFCTNGKVTVLEADKLGITNVATAADASSPNTLQFSFTTSKPIESGQSLTFVVTKTPADPKKSTQEIKSAPFVYTVAYAEVAAAITNVAIADKKVTVTGSGFLNTTTNPLAALLHSDGKNADVLVTLAAGQTTEKLTFDIPAGVGPGCWNVHVKLGSMETAAPNKAGQKILSEATPKLTGATLGTSAITVKGEQLVDTSGCGGKALTFKAGPNLVDVSAKLDSPTEATLSVPADATKGWTVQLLQGGTKVSETKLQ
jgi:hypothetical protein